EHRPEFQKRERDSMLADAFLPEQNRPAGSQLDRSCDDQKYRREYRQQEQAAQKIDQPLRGAAQPVHLLALFEIWIKGWVAGAIRILRIPVIRKHVKGKFDPAELIGVEPFTQYRADPGKECAEDCVVV